MPPRRSTAASAAKRAAEQPANAANGGAKRHKANGEPMAAAADVSGSGDAAAAQFSSASTAAAASSQPSADPASAASAAASFIPLPESMDCRICAESFPSEEECKDEGVADRVPRSLFCSPKPHTYCTKCLRGMVKRGKDEHGNRSVSSAYSHGIGSCTSIVSFDACLFIAHVCDSLRSVSSSPQLHPHLLSRVHLQTRAARVSAAQRRRRCGWNRW